jgi:hypothetical protein
MNNPEFVQKLEGLAGERKIVACPRFCDGGFRGMDACNTCETAGSGFYLDGRFYPNTEHGWRNAYTAFSNK